MVPNTFTLVFDVFSGRKSKNLIKNWWNKLVTLKFYPSAGERMAEPEVDALMQGQEDENGSVNYEGTVSKQTKLTFSLLKKKQTPHR